MWFYAGTTLHIFASHFEDLLSGSVNVAFGTGWKSWVGFQTLSTKPGPPSVLNTLNSMEMVGILRIALLLTTSAHHISDFSFHVAQNFLYKNCYIFEPTLLQALHPVQLLQRNGVGVLTTTAIHEGGGKVCTLFLVLSHLFTNATRI